MARRGLAATLGKRARSFERGASSPGLAQERVLRTLLELSARTEYGRRLAVDGRESYEQWVKKVPIVDYEDMEPWIDRQAAVRAPIITPDPVVIFEETSGTSGARKLIPYTARLLDAFDHWFSLWVRDLLLRGPPFRSGRSFLSISPALRERRRTASGVPIGFEDDAQYLSRRTRRLFGSRLVGVEGVGGIRDMSNYRRCLAARLVAQRDLEILSVWSPTYLGSLMDWVTVNREQVARDLERGFIEVEGSVVPLPNRPELVCHFEGDEAVDWERLWPGLKLISCWLDGAAGLYADRLRRAFPSVLIQGKGLLATEAPLTVPRLHSPAPVPLLDRVFFEFQDYEGRILRLGELTEDSEYELIVSQAGGLTRYRMNDVVRTGGRFRQTPCLRFVGRAHDVTDLAGEKLHERFVRRAIGRSRPDDGSFSVLVPVQRTDGPSYYLCVTDRDADACSSISESLEAELQRAIQYRQARGLGQLEAVRTLVCADARERYDRHFLARGMKWGEIKYDALIEPVLESDLGHWISP